MEVLYAHVLTKRDEIVDLMWVVPSPSRGAARNFGPLCAAVVTVVTTSSWAPAIHGPLELS